MTLPVQHRIEWNSWNPDLRIDVSVPIGAKVMSATEGVMNFCHSEKQGFSISPIFQSKTRQSMTESMPSISQCWADTLFASLVHISSERDLHMWLWKNHHPNSIDHSCLW